MHVDIRLISSLEKVFWDEDLKASELQSASALRGERYSFQAACRLNEGNNDKVSALIESPLSEHIEVYEVKQVPVTMPCSSFDSNYLRTVPGLYPDLLVSHKGEMSVVDGQWRCLWISVVIPEDAVSGIVPVHVKLVPTYDEATTTPGAATSGSATSGAATSGAATILAEATFTLKIINATLPKQTLIHTEWFHCDCLATHYNVPVFSEEHWSIIDNYMANSARYGQNMILTPVFTPPLDTQVGGERPTVQLVDVSITDGKTSFNFDKLTRYINMAEKNGILYFEISHLFTQWGAAHAPKIMATVDGEHKRIFGWETDALSEEYITFINLFLGELRKFLEQSGCPERCYFHISDEPSIHVIDSYRKASESIRDVLEGCNIIDALSDYELYKEGLIRKPIPANSHIDQFIDNGVEGLWTYYCCCQGQDVSNRFMAMPSARNRILGYQLYKYHIEGFLHWGYNFWYSRLSRGPVNPYTETSAVDAFPAGDAFLVYPGEDGKPLPSIRQVVFNEALQDLRALQLIETVLSFNDVIKILEAGSTITFKEYPHTADWIIKTRENINKLIEEKVQDTCEYRDNPY